MYRTSNFVGRPGAARYFFCGLRLVMAARPRTSYAATLILRFQCVGPEVAWLHEAGGLGLGGPLRRLSLWRVELTDTCLQFGHLRIVVYGAIREAASCGEDYWRDVLPERMDLGSCHGTAQYW